MLTFPALSVQVPLTVCPAPSDVSVTGAEQESIPERLSVPVNDTVALVLFQPFALGAGDSVAAATGGVLSILTFAVTGTLTFPALSVQVPLTVVRRHRT